MITDERTNGDEMGLKKILVVQVPSWSGKISYIFISSQGTKTEGLRSSE